MAVKYKSASLVHPLCGRRSFNEDEIVAVTDHYVAVRWRETYIIPLSNILALVVVNENEEPAKAPIGGAKEKKGGNRSGRRPT